jgi:hypothetical protein
MFIESGLKENHARTSIRSNACALKIKLKSQL